MSYAVLISVYGDRKDLKKAIKHIVEHDELFEGVSMYWKTMDIDLRK